MKTKVLLSHEELKSWNLWRLTETTILPLWPLSIDFQALPISDDQTINELCSISLSHSTWYLLQDVCVCASSCVCEWQWRDVCFCACHLIGSLSAELQSHRWRRPEMTERPPHAHIHHPPFQKRLPVMWVSHRRKYYMKHDFKRIMTFIWSISNTNKALAISVALEILSSRHNQYTENSETQAKTI